MRSNVQPSDRRQVVATFDALTADLDEALQLSFDSLTTPECLALLERVEVLRRRLPALEHPLINRIAAQSDADELGGKLHWALADRLLISRHEAHQRVDAAANLGPRHALNGQPLPPVLPNTAAAQRRGHLGPEQVGLIRKFFHKLPDDTYPDLADRAERHLAKLGTKFRPDELVRLANRLADCLNPDGIFSDVDRARRRSLVLGNQDADGMSPIKGFLNPEARATLDAVLARWAAPGMCNPDDESPCVDGTPSQAAIDADRRSTAQRNHDALNALGRAMLSSGRLGDHNGLPVSIIVSTTLADLEAAAKAGLSGGPKARTATGSWLPITEVLRLAGHAHHYLRIYQGAKELALFHTKRLASPAQRIVLYAKELGCSHPNCSVPAGLTEVHHVVPFAERAETAIENLTLRCGPHHRLIEPGGWSTRTNRDGEVETIPPAHLERGQPRVNRYHHPERLLRESEDDGSDEDGP